MAEKYQYHFELRKAMEILGFTAKEWDQTIRAVEVLANLAGRTLIHLTDKIATAPTLEDFYDEEAVAAGEEINPLDELQGLSTFLNDVIVDDVLKKQLSNQWELPEFNKDLQHLKELVDGLSTVYYALYHEKWTKENNDRLSTQATFYLWTLMDNMQEILDIYIAGRTSTTLMRQSPLDWFMKLWHSQQDNKPKN